MMKKTSANPVVLAAVALLAAPAAEAATVRSVSAAKGLVALNLDEGETANKGDTFCVVGKKDKKIDCGKVTKVKGSVAILAMKTPAKVASIKKGMTAKSSGAPAGGAPADDSGAADATTEDTKAAPEVATGIPASKRNPMRLWLLSDPALASPYTYKQISYKAPDGTNVPTTLWQTGKAPGLTVVSFGGQLAIPVGKKAVVVGARYRSYAASSIDTDYTAGIREPYASTAVSAKSMGGWLDYQLAHVPLTSSVFFNFLPGLDLDYSTVSLTATKKNDDAPDSGNIVTATSKLMLASLRLGGNFDVFIGKSFGLTLGATLIVPLMPLSTSLTADFPTGEDRGLATAVDDLKSALGHKKNSAGMEVLLAAFFAF